MQTAKRLCCALALLSSLLFGSSSAWAAEPDPHEAETALLHRRLDLGGVRMLDAAKLDATKNNRWVPLGTEGARLIVVHLRAIACAPCVAEMPLLRNIARGWRNEPAVRLVFVSETLDEQQLKEFWLHTNRGRVPETPLAQSVDDRIRDALGTGKQPLTLLLDADLVVRQAFIGSLAARSAELAEGMSRLLRTLNARR